MSFFVDAKAGAFSAGKTHSCLVQHLGASNWTSCLVAVSFAKDGRRRRRGLAVATIARNW